MEVYTPKQASEEFFKGTISSRTIIKWFHSGRLRGTKIAKKILIYRSSLEELVKENENSPPPTKKATPKKRSGSRPGTLKHFT